MIPLIIWDMLWVVLIQSRMGSKGLCPSCIASYILNSYFVAGFCEELLKYCAVRRLKNSLLTPDHRCLMVYGLCAGAGFATVENILYVFSSDFITALSRAFSAVPLHCLTGALIGMGLAKEKCLGIRTPFYKSNMKKMFFIHHKFIYFFPKSFLYLGCFMVHTTLF